MVIKFMNSSLAYDTKVMTCNYSNMYNEKKSVRSLCSTKVPLKISNISLSKKSVRLCNDQRHCTEVG